MIYFYLGKNIIDSGLNSLKLPEELNFRLLLTQGRGYKLIEIRAMTITRDILPENRIFN